MSLEQEIANQVLPLIKELPRQHDIKEYEVVYQYDNKNKKHKWRVYIYGAAEYVRFVDASYDAWEFYQSGSDRDLVANLIRKNVEEFINGVS